MKTLHLKETDEDFDRGAEIIRDGGLVAFPTETVYGLGADALNPDAVLKIYRVKGRPADNPSIVHIADYEDIRELAAEVTEDMEILMKTFWPGPMTMIVPAKEIIPKVTTGGLDTVGIRMPRGASCRELVRRSGCPIAAPSANISGKPSPTEAQHVIDDFEGIDSDDSPAGHSHPGGFRAGAGEADSAGSDPEPETGSGEGGAFSAESAGTEVQALCAEGADDHLRGKGPGAGPGGHGCGTSGTGAAGTECLRHRL